MPPRLINVICRLLQSRRVLVMEFEESFLEMVLGINAPAERLQIRIIFPAEGHLDHDQNIRVRERPRPAFGGIDSGTQIFLKKPPQFDP